MDKKIKTGQCVYCGEEKKVTTDHVISSCLFPESYIKKNIITAPSCEGCNGGFSKDEEYFRIFISGLALEHSKYADELFFTKVKRSIIKRGSKIGRKVRSRMRLVDLYTKSGIYLGKKTGIIPTEEDWERYFNVLDKYLKGLFFHEFKAILPPSHKIKHSLGKEEILSKLLLKIFRWNWDNKEIFAYGYTFIPDIPDVYRSIWVTIFYDSIFFISFIGLEKDFELLKKVI